MIIREARRYLREKSLNETHPTPEEKRDLLFRLIEASFGLTDES
jgi:hypothetical protein